MIGSLVHIDFTGGEAQLWLCCSLRPIKLAPVVDLALDAPPICGFEKRDSSSLGFTTTFWMGFFSGGTGVAHSQQRRNWKLA